MSNLDTILREKWKSEVGGIVCQCGNPINIDRVNDFWLDKFDQLMKEKREACCPACKILLQLKDEE